MRIERCLVKRMVVSSALVLLAALSTVSQAQTFPNKPIRVLVPYAAGGGVDIVARAVSHKLQEIVGQPVIVDNRPGGNEIIASEVAARATPDGHTLLFASSTIAINVSLATKLPYDTERDFAPIAKLVDVPFALFAVPSVPAATLKELAALAKAQPGKFNYGHLGTASPHYLMMEAFKRQAGIDIAAIPYKGVAPVIAGMFGGEIQLTIAGIGTAMPHLKAGKLKLLAVTSDKRIGSLPDYPTTVEAGFSDVATSVWYGAFTAAATPPEVVMRLNAALRRALADSDVSQRLGSLGFETASTSTDEFGRTFRADVLAWTKIVKATGATTGQ
jgi:tripartite-type tricarboxylate transporter receptor subunit TctC